MSSKICVRLQYMHVNAIYQFFIFKNVIIVWEIAVILKLILYFFELPDLFWEPHVCYKVMNSGE